MFYSLQTKKLTELKQIAKDLGVMPPKGQRRQKANWITAIQQAQLEQGNNISPVAHLQHCFEMTSVSHPSDTSESQERVDFARLQLEEIYMYQHIDYHPCEVENFETPEEQHQATTEEVVQGSKQLFQQLGKTDAGLNRLQELLQELRDLKRKYNQ